MTVAVGLVNNVALFAKIERFRNHGLDVVTAVDLTAEQHEVESEDLAVAHFAWLVRSQDSEEEEQLAA